MKIFITVLTIVMTFTLSGCESLKGKASNIFWNVINEQFDREEAARLQKIANHEVVIGRDTVAVFGKHYDIGKTYDLNGNRIDHLSVVIEDAEGVILSGVTHRDRKNGQYYVISEEGYAVIDKNDYCRVYLTVPEEEQDKIESKYIEYLDSYEGFSEKERKYFEKMQKK
ncbi:MAG: hypothetical protein IJC09_01580 [Clostridia bacterium]|nr:hypothetical protein [Clostridia bacterium]